MSYVLTFIGGAMVGCLLGVVAMCCCIVSGRCSRKEEEMSRESDACVG